MRMKSYASLFELVLVSLTYILFEILIIQLPYSIKVTKYHEIKFEK